MSDFLSFIVWWILVQLLGLAAWPIGFRLLQGLPDRGYTLLKPLGLLLVSYLVWLAASLHALPNTPATIVLIWLLIAVIGWLPALRQRHDPQGFFAQLRPWLRERRSLIIAYEVVFAVAFAGWALLRAYNPEVVTGEKIMAFSFINAIQRSTWFPPHDPWLSGYTLPYYYFGHLMIALMSKISSIKVGAIIPLSNALWFGLTAATAFGVVANLVLASSANVKRAAVLFGVLGAIMITVMGNWEAPLEVLRAADTSSAPFWVWLDIRDLDENYPQPETGQPRWPPVYDQVGWWWRASRLIHDYPPASVSPQMAAVLGRPPDPSTEVSDVIDEFPQFTFLLGEVHAHVLSLPFVLIVIGLALNVYWSAVQRETAVWRSSLLLWLLYPIAIGSVGFLNSWDLPTYLLLWSAALGLGRWQAGTFRLWRWARDVIVVTVFSVVCYWPYYSNFRPPIGGVWPNIFYGTRASQFFIMFGPFMVIGGLFGLKLLMESIRLRQLRPIGFAVKSLLGGLGLVVALAGGAALLGLITFRSSPSVQQWFNGQLAAMAEHNITLADHLRTRIFTPWVPLSLAIAVAALILIGVARTRRAAQRNIDSPDPPPVNFILLLFGIGLLVSLAAEFIFVLDLEKTRANTVFKLYYQAWMVWSIAAAYGVYDLLASSTRIRSRAIYTAVSVVIALSIGLGLLYPALAITTLAPIPQPTLDGIAAFISSPERSSARDAYAIAHWLNQNVVGAPVLLEGSDGKPGYRVARSRISSWTGLPVPLGWAYHEQQWRGTDTIQRQRNADVATIYSTLDPSVALDLLKRYKVEYVFVGGFERMLYPAEGLAKFDQILPLVFQQGNAKLYRVPLTTAQ